MKVWGNYGIFFFLILIYMTNGKRRYNSKKSANKRTAPKRGSKPRRKHDEEMFPTYKTFKLEYSTPLYASVPTSQSTGYAAGCQILANCIYNPIGSSSHFGYGQSAAAQRSVQEYDTIKAVYNKYAVTGCKVEYKVTNLTTAPLVAMLQAGNDQGMIGSTSAGPPSLVCSRDYVSSRVFNIYKNATITRYINIKKIISSKNGSLSGLDYLNSFDTRSVNFSVWCDIAVGRLDDTNLGFDYSGSVKLTFYGYACDKKKETDQTTI